MSQKFAVSGQHYLFNVQAFAHTVLHLGGKSYEYALRDRTTARTFEDVATGESELGVIVQTTATADALNVALAAKGLAFHPLVESRPMVALPKSHPLSSAEVLTLEQLDSWPYLYFEQEPDADVAFAEEALSSVERDMRIACTDRASLSEMATALNGYTITSGILVGITDGGSLATVPLDTDERLTLGYVTREGAELSVAATCFVGYLEKSLKVYAK